MDRGELKRIETPELEEARAIYYYPNLNAGEFLKLAKHIDVTSGRVDMDVMPELIMALSRDASGARLFPDAHRQVVLQWPAEVMLRIAGELSDVLTSVVDRMGK
jgi:hypothetical protein